VKPFLLLATRAEDAAADNEYESFMAFAGLGVRDLRRWWLAAAASPRTRPLLLAGQCWRWAGGDALRACA